VKRWVFILGILFVLHPVIPQGTGATWADLTLNHHIHDDSGNHLVFVHRCDADLRVEPMIAVFSNFSPRHGVLGHILGISIPVMVPDSIISMRARIGTESYDILPVQTAIGANGDRFVLMSFYILTPEMHSALYRAETVTLTLRGNTFSCTIRNAEYVTHLEHALQAVTSELAAVRTLRGEFTDRFGEYVRR